MLKKVRAKEMKKSSTHNQIMREEIRKGVK
jgi:hypothetical protein